MKKFTHIPVPTLAIFAIPHSHGKWVDERTDPKVREDGKLSTPQQTLTAKQAKVFEESRP